MANKMDVVAALISDGRRYLVSRRPEEKHLGGFWEFPGGKPEEEETDAEALRRELREELRLQVAVGERLLSVEHQYEDRTVQLHFYSCRRVPEDQQPVSVECSNFKWVQPQDMKSMKFPPADETLIQTLCDREDRRFTGNPE